MSSTRTNLIPNPRGKSMTPKTTPCFSEMNMTFNLQAVNSGKKMYTIDEQNSQLHESSRQRITDNKEETSKSSLEKDQAIQTPKFKVNSPASNDELRRQSVSFA